MPDTNIPTKVLSEEVVPSAATAPPSFVQIRPFAAIVAGVAWVLFIGMAEAATPPPDPDVAPGVMADSISLAFTIALMASIAGLAMRQRWGLAATAAGGGMLVLGSLVCFAGGHTGLAPLVQLASGVGLASVGTVLARAPSARS